MPGLSISRTTSCTLSRAVERTASGAGRSRWQSIHPAVCCLLCQNGPVSIYPSFLLRFLGDPPSIRLSSYPVCHPHCHPSSFPIPTTTHSHNHPSSFPIPIPHPQYHPSSLPIPIPNSQYHPHFFANTKHRLRKFNLHPYALWSKIEKNTE